MLSAMRPRMRSLALTLLSLLAACSPDLVMTTQTPPPKPMTPSGTGGGSVQTTMMDSGGCTSDADCRPHEHCSGGELAQCIPDPTADAGTPPVITGDGGVTTPIDLSCESQTNPPKIYPPKWPTLPPTVPAGCRTGFEMNEPYEYLQNKLYTIHSKTPAGSEALTLELDFATYQAPDGLKITGTLANGETYVLYLTCRMQTADYGDPTDGQSRPPEDSIRDYRLDLKAGTVRLDFDYGRSSTPTYTKVTGLCDFDVTPPPATMMTSLHWWRSF
jgi:hypothetical protein